MKKRKEERGKRKEERGKEERRKGGKEERRKRGKRKGGKRKEEREKMNLVTGISKSQLLQRSNGIIFHHHLRRFVSKFDLIWFDLIWFDLIWFDLIWKCTCSLTCSSSLFLFFSSCRSSGLVGSSKTEIGDVGKSIGELISWTTSVFWFAKSC